MTHVLVTVSGGIIDQVTFHGSKSEALRAIASFVKVMNPEEDDAAVFNERGLVVNAKDFLDENDQFTDDGQHTEATAAET